MFILDYDENDGFFDHVPPITPPKGTADEFVTLNSPGGTPGGGLNLGSGFRVPAIVVSPWTVGGYVCSDPLDHTSALRFLERVTGVTEPNISDWRRSHLQRLHGGLPADRRSRLRPSPPHHPRPRRRELAYQTQQS